MGNDACWSQIARDQVPMLGSIVGCSLEVGIHVCFNRMTRFFAYLLVFKVR